MTAQEMYEKLDGLFAAHAMEQVEPFLLSCLQEADDTENGALYLAVCNELMGFYRSVSAFEKATLTARHVLDWLREAPPGLREAQLLATTFVNAATAFRAAGQLEESYTYYQQALPLYEQALPPGDYRLAGLYNNLGLLLEQMDRNQEAGEALEKALAIVTPIQGAQIERAITLTNLAQIDLKQEREAQAKERLLLAQRLFLEPGGEPDAHYGAVLSGLGSLAFRGGDYAEALACYRQALEEVKKNFGETLDYAALLENCAAACGKLGDTPLQRRYLERAGEVRARLARQ